MTANNQMVSARGYARLRGVSHVAVLKNIERGKIRTHGGKINVAEADASLETQKVTFAEALRRKTQAQAEREELRLLQEQNRVVLIETVVAKQIEVNSIIRARLWQSLQNSRLFCSGWIPERRSRRGYKKKSTTPCRNWRPTAKQRVDPVLNSAVLTKHRL